jgi:heat shock protein HslJ
MRWRIRDGARVAAIGLAMAVLALACGGTATPTPSGSGSASGLDGRWVLTSYVSPDGTQFTVPAAVLPTLTLSGNAAQGNAGCNTYNAIATIDATTIKFSQVQSTKNPCPAPMSTVETVFLQALNLASQYQLTGDMLVIQAPLGKPSLTFHRGS